MYMVEENYLNKNDSREIFVNLTLDRKLIRNYIQMNINLLYFYLIKLNLNLKIFILNNT